jgi:hypothetical protein
MKDEAKWWRVLGDAHLLAARDRKHPLVRVTDKLGRAVGLCMVTYPFANENDHWRDPQQKPDNYILNAMYYQLSTYLNPGNDREYHEEAGAMPETGWWWSRYSADGLRERADACYLLAAMAEVE